MNRIVSKLYQLARGANDVSKIFKGPLSIIKRVGNKFIGRKFLKRIFFD